jgi:hypothetical protein
MVIDTKAETKTVSVTFWPTHTSCETAVKPYAPARHGSTLTTGSEWGLYNAAKRLRKRNRSPRSGGSEFHRQDPRKICVLPEVHSAQGFPQDPYMGRASGDPAKAHGWTRPSFLSCSFVLWYMRGMIVWNSANTP